MDDEYKAYGRETNKAISEYADLPAFDYNKSIPEVDNSTKENKDDIKENYNTGSFKAIEIRKKEYLPEKPSDNKPSDNKPSFRNSADGHKSPDLNAKYEVKVNLPTGGETTNMTAVAEEASTATATTTASATTVATVSGATTVAALATVGVVAIAGSGIMAPAPKIVSEVYDSGTNYLTYEIDLEELTEGSSYKIRVSNANYFIEYPVFEAGLQKQLVTGLTPYRKYDVEVIGESEFGDIVYHTTPVYTNKEPKPKAIFEFTPIFDYLNGTFSLEYSTFISDFYKTGKDTYQEIYVGTEKEPRVVDRTLNDENFFVGEIEGLSDLSTITATVYTYYYDEWIEIGNYGYKPIYPEGFEPNTAEKVYALYNVSEPTITYTDTEYVLTFDTGFTANNYLDSYIIDIYKKEETELVALTNELITSYEGSDKICNISIPANINDIDIYFTGVKNLNGEAKKYETRKIRSYSLSEAKKSAPKPTADVVFTEDYEPIDDIYNVDYDVNISAPFGNGGNYRVDEIINDRVINSVKLDGLEYHSSFKLVNTGSIIAVVVYSDYGDEKEQIVIGTLEKKIEHPEPFNIEFRTMEDGYFLEVSYIKDDSEKNFVFNMKHTYKDGSVYDETPAEFVGSYESETGTLAEGMKITDVEKFDISIKYNDKEIKTLTVFPNDASASFGEFEVDADGNVLLPYEITVPTGAKFVDAFISFDGTFDYFNEDTLTGVVKITELRSNILKPSLEIKYELDGAIIMNDIVSDDINIGAEFDVSYYASHYNSFYTTVNVRYETTVDGKDINMNLLPYVLDTGDDGIIYVPIEEKVDSQNSPYNDFYVINIPYITDEDNPEENGYKFGYKITAEGFEDTNVEHVVKVDDKSAETISNNVSAGYVVNRVPYVDYIKTVNEDGTANYYFDTKLTQETNNYYGRIEYSYKVGDKTKYKYTDFSQGKTIALTNLVDRDYVFEYAVYYLEDGIYYDTEPFSNKYSYVGKENKNSDTLNVLNATVSDYAVDRDTIKVFDFELDYNNLDRTKPVTVKYGNLEYELEIKDRADVDPSAILDSSGDNSYKASFDLGNENSYIVLVNADDGKSKIQVELILRNDSVTESNTLDVTFSSSQSTFVNSYISDNGGVNDILRYETLNAESNITICGYTGTYDIEEFTDSTTESTGSDKNRITIEAPNFSASDSRDTLMAVAYCGDDVVATGEMYNNSITLDIDPAYTNIDVKIFEVKGQIINLLSTSLPSQEGYRAMYKEIAYKSFTFNEISVINDIEVAEDGDSLFVRVTPNSDVTFADYYVKAVLPQNTGTEDFEGGNGETEVEISKNLVKSSIIVEIYRKPNSYSTPLLCGRYQLATDATLSDFEYDDGTDFVKIPYEISLPEGAVIDTANSSISYQTGDTIANPQTFAKKGYIVIDDLKTSEIEITFVVAYSIMDDENNVIRHVSYSFTKTHELDGTLNLDYTINSIFASSDYGTFSVGYTGYKYDTSTGIIYTLNQSTGEYLDENNNQAPENSSVVDAGKFYNNLYYLDGKVVSNIGCFNVPYSGEYTLNVTKAGGNIFDTSTGNKKASNQINDAPPNELSTYTENSSNNNIYITFLHTTVDSYYEQGDSIIHGINNCQLEFNITSGGKVIISKNIEFTEPRGDSIPNESSFTYDRATTNSTVTMNSDDTINMTIDTGFNSNLYPDFAYKVELYEEDYNTNALALAYESDTYYTASTATINNVLNKNYEVYVVIYKLQDGEYIRYGGISGKGYNLGRANSVLVDKNWEYVDGNYINKIRLDTNYINMSSPTAVSFESDAINLTISTAQTVGACTVKVTDEGNGIYYITISSTNMDDPKGNLVVEQGNTTIGYTQITYSI